MPQTVRVTLTGICSVLRDYERVLLPNAARVAKTCGGMSLPIHRPYIRYRLSHDKLGTVPDKVNDPRKPVEGAIFLHGDEIILKGTPRQTTPKPTKLKHVAAMEDVHPGLQLDPAILKHPADLSHAAVAAYLPLKGGTFAVPNVDVKRTWHFFPQKGNPVQGPLAQAVTYTIDFAESNCIVALKPFGATNATDILDLQASTGGVEIVIGNTIEDDIFPTDTTAEPNLGPDRHFEIYYRFASTPPACPLPIPYYEGDSSDAGGRHGGGGHVHASGVTQQPSMANVIGTAATATKTSGFLAIGGTNCPPNQWP